MNRHKDTPPDAIGALYFLPGQYLFKRFDDESGLVQAKALSGGQISRAFSDYQTDTDWLERRILRYSERAEGCAFLSVEPAGIRRIFLETAEGEIREIKLPLPTLVLLGKGREYFLWAAKEKRQITRDTLLAVAPLPNVGREFSGKICFGKNEPPEAKAENIDAVWDLVFDTPFSSDHKSQKCRSQPEDVRRLLLELSRTGKKTFPVSELIVSNASLAQIWERIVESESGRRF